jgi:archaellum biogenesis ATPase FlaH
MTSETTGHEARIVRACINDRGAYELFSKYGDAGGFSPPGRHVLKIVRGYYELDGSARQCGDDIVRERASRLSNPKHAEQITAYIQGLPADISLNNVIHDIREHRRGAIADRLSVALANRSPEVPALLKEYAELDQVGLEPEPEARRETIKFRDTSRWREPPKATDQLIKLWPGALNQAVGGGARRGHQILVFARPEGGKTLFTINMVAGFLKQKLNVLYIGNEEPIADLDVRIAQRLLKMSRYQVNQDRPKVGDLLDSLPIGELYLEGLSPGSIPEISKLIEEYTPDVLVLDQLRNLRMADASRVEQLEQAATAARNLGKRYGLLVVSVTQAGDSATGKVYLDLNDVDSSKTGIPAQADLMIGVGGSADMLEGGMLGISLCKNKLSGEHSRFTVQFNKQTGQISSGVPSGVST